MSVNVMVLGDICPSIGDNESVEERILAGQGRELIKPVVPLLEKADLVIGNLEAAVYEGDAPILKCGPPLAMKPETMRRLRDDMGIDAFTLANNHIGDHGYDGLKSTVDELAAAGVPFCGAGLTHEDACRPMTFEIKGKSLAVFNFAEGEYSQAQYDEAGTARLDPFFSQKRVMDARSEYDFIIVILHVGNEHLPIPSPDTLSNCRSMAAAGADAVISHHAHIPQFMETLDGVPICYSIGNFLFGQTFNGEKNPGWHITTLADVTLDDDGAAVKLHSFRQLEDLALRELSPRGSELLADYFEKCRTICADPATYRKIWEQELRGKFGKNICEGFLSTIEQFTQGTYEEREKAVKLRFNLFNCETHRERFARALRLLYDGKEKSDPEAETVIEELIATLREVLLEA